jgi:hypothetical protein
MKRSGFSCAPLVAAVMSASLIASGDAVAQDAGRLDTLKDLFKQIGQCWRSPQLPDGDLGMQITVLVAFNRKGEIMGQPRITFESQNTTDDDRLAYRKAVMETLQRCTPLSFTDGLGGAIAGQPIAIRFDDRRKLPKPKERDT